MIKVLSIGNSFSEDAQYYLHDLSMHGEEEIYCVNLFIGGCSLETHCMNIRENKKAYRYELNGKHTDRTRAIEEVLMEEEWDYVTLQQASWLSGKEETYIPYFDELYNFVRARTKATIIMHETWAYEISENNPKEKRDESYNRISATYKKFASEYNMKLIPVGDVLQTLRGTDEFDYAAGQPSLNRDGAHLGMDYGRYAAALTWYKVLTGNSVKDIGFLPYEFKITNDSLAKIKKIKEVVEAI
ncbi:MAG: DUF4886 domain-containing protein [Clostridia bacterium]|nr:DUF4886 domain-containing protein [Clostridia bacterium]